MSRYLVFLLILFFAHNAYPSIDEGKNYLPRKDVSHVMLLAEGNLLVLIYGMSRRNIISLT